MSVKTETLLKVNKLLEDLNIEEVNLVNISSSINILAKFPNDDKVKVFYYVRKHFNNLTFFSFERVYDNVYDERTKELISSTFLHHQLMFASK